MTTATTRKTPSKNGFIFYLRIPQFCRSGTGCSKGVDNAIRRINHHPADSVVCPLDSDLSGGWRYPAFEQPGPVLCACWSRNLLKINMS